MNRICDEELKLSSSRYQHNPYRDDSWSIILGGWGGTKSVIRESRHGDDVFTDESTKEWNQNMFKSFELKLIGTELYVYHGQGKFLMGEVYLFCFGFFSRLTFSR